MLRTLSFVIHRAESGSSFPFAGLSARSQRDCKQSIVERDIALVRAILNFASFVEFALLRYAGIPGRRLVVEYVRTDTWKYISALTLKRVEGDGHGVTKHVVATYFLAMCCTVPLTPCVGCHFKPGAIPRIFNRERVTRREGFPSPHDTVSDSVRGRHLFQLPRSELGRGVGAGHDPKRAPPQGLAFWRYPYPVNQLKLECFPV